MKTEVNEKRTGSKKRFYNLGRGKSKNQFWVYLKIKDFSKKLK